MAQVTMSDTPSDDGQCVQKEYYCPSCCLFLGKTLHKKIPSGSHMFYHMGIINGIRFPRYCPWCGLELDYSGADAAKSYLMSKGGK